LAEYQIAWWGHPITSGIPTIDYYFGLDVEVNGAIDHYSEQLVRMNYMNTSPILAVSKEILKLNEFDLGIPENSKFCSVIGRLFKFHPIFDEALFEILERTPSNIYLVFIAEQVSEINKLLFDRLHNSTRFSVDLINRIKLVEFKYYKEVLVKSECVLDTFPYGGCLTAHDALSNGIPMVTMPMEHVRGRYSYGIYRQMEHTELIARNIYDYIQIAVKILTDKSYQSLQSQEVYFKFHNILNKNHMVAQEWYKFFQVLLRSIV
jgi:predicted O-linked N-acetylglucosamine transferase (SPINDLY family)